MRRLFILTLLITSPSSVAIPPSDRLPCYTENAPSDASSGPPCALKEIILNHCSTCHDNTRDQRFRRIDMTAWILLEDGTYGFPHLDRYGRQRKRADTYAQILERIESNDPEERMPLGDQLNTLDIEAFKRWMSEN